MISSILTPVRWYSELSESDRFSTDCDICDYELICDKTRLLPFQFRRPASPYPIVSYFLRKECVDITKDLVSVADATFISNTGFWTLVNFNIQTTTKIKALGNAVSLIERLNVFTIGKFYKVKVVVNDFHKLNTSLFVVNSALTVNDTLNFNAANTFTVIFQADQTDFVINGNGLGLVTDYILIDEVQISEYQPFDLLVGDFELDLSVVNVANINEFEDVISYCGDSLSLTKKMTLPCGNHYMIMVDAEDNIYCSELLTIKDFIPSQSPYTLLEWYNSCDLSDVIYNTSPFITCSYRNRLYVNGQLTKAVYPFKEELETDGNQDTHVTFQKWEKNQSLIVAKAPDFIVDSLTAMRLHDNLLITKSLRKTQTYIETRLVIEVEKVETELALVFNDCAQNVELKFLMKDKIVDTTCCTNTPVSECLACTTSINSANFYQVAPTAVFGLALDFINGINRNFYYDFSNFFGQMIGGIFDLFSVVISRTDTNIGNGAFTITGNVTSDYLVGQKVIVTNTSLLFEPLNVGPFIIASSVYTLIGNYTTITWAGQLPIVLAQTYNISPAIFTQNRAVLCIDTYTNWWRFNPAPHNYWSSDFPKINFVGDTDLGGGNHSYTIQGFIFENTYSRIKVEIFDVDTTLTTNFTLPQIYSAAELYGIVSINNIISWPVAIPTNGTIKFSLTNFTLSCVYLDGQVNEDWTISYP